MTQSIALVTAFLKLMDTVYKAQSKTSMLDAMTEAPSFLNANEVKVMKLSTTGLGNYSRTTGYPAGDMNATWEAMQLTVERGRSFTLDRMDNEESLGLLLGKFISEWMRVNVAPEVDATRLAKYAAGAGNIVSAGATLSASTIKAAIRAAHLALDEDEVPEEGRKLFMSSTCYSYLEEAVGRTLSNEDKVKLKVTEYDDMEVIKVPQARFYTQVTLDPGSSSDAGGYAKTSSTGKDINFMIIHPTAVCQPIKLNQVKYFTPEANILTDGHLWQYRLYHDAFVYDNHENGIYLHHKA